MVAGEIAARPSTVLYISSISRSYHMLLLSRNFVKSSFVSSSGIQKCCQISTNSCKLITDWNRGWQMNLQAVPRAGRPLSDPVRCSTCDSAAGCIRSKNSKAYLDECNRRVTKIPNNPNRAELSTSNAHQDHIEAANRPRLGRQLRSPWLGIEDLKRM